MIIVELEIENYKQFAGEHRIAFPPGGAVAIIGHNGAGKTTLFEAIEWALYGPRSIASGDIRPRQGTGSGAPCVRVTLQTADGKRFQVERKLRGKANSAEAAIYEVDEAGDILSTVVTGPKDVSQRVAGKLVGLSHAAFVSTFFTRQKELSFFGDQKDTERRRNVSRLLGQETIQTAQSLIADDRKDVDTRARGMLAQYTHETEGRDFAAERTQRTADIQSAEGEVEEAEQAVTSRTREHQQAQDAEQHWLNLSSQDNELRQRITAVDGQIASATDRVKQIGERLARLDTREAELARLEPIAAREPELRATVERWQRERERAIQQQALTKRLADITRNRDSRVVTLRQIVAAGETVPGWVWHPGEDATPVAAADRLRGVAAGVDVATARTYAESVARAVQSDEIHHTARTHAATCTKWLAQLRGDLETLLVGTDPAEQARSAEQEQTAAVAAGATATAEARALTAEAGKLRKSISQLRDQGAGSCPTCGQPIDEIVIRTLETGIREREREATEQERLAANARQRATAAAQTLTVARQRQDEVNTLRERLRNGEKRTEEATTAAAAAESALRDALEVAGVRDVPSAETVQAALKRVESLAGVSAQAGRLADVAKQFREDDDLDAETHRELNDLGTVLYDEAAHRAASQALGEAQGARGQTGEIRDELTQRPALTEAHASATADLAERRAERIRLERERATIGFDADAFTSARAMAKVALDALLAANEARNAVANQLRDAKAVLSAIEAEQERLAKLEAAARQAERDAHQLKQMYDGFTEFERWVALQMNPHLADRAGEILNEVTGGAYDRVHFDENYGLYLYDGDEAFPVSQFSGGERDVASLAARLALSRLIGAQAAHPPAFVVLDEVFGSLDQERRAKLLGMLDVLTNDDTDGFRQLFVISHVDDIRQSQAFDEIWRIQEDGQGISQWENLQLTGGIEEL